MSPKGDCTLNDDIKVIVNERLLHTPISLLINGEEIKVTSADSHLEMTRKHKGWAKVRTITYKGVLENGIKFVTKMHLSTMKIDVHLEKETK